MVMYEAIFLFDDRQEARFQEVVFPGIDDNSGFLIDVALEECIIIRRDR